MIVVAGSVRIRPDRRVAAAAACSAVAQATRQEPGCQEYAFYASLEDPEIVHVFERWENEETLQAHLQTEHVAKFFAALADLIATPPDVTIYQVAHQRPL